jgi:hypothetical protein
MGWHSKIMRGVKALGGLFLLSVAFLIPGRVAQAQLPGDICATTPDNCYAALCNAYLCLYVGYGKNVAGSIGMISTPNSVSDPGGAGFGNLLLWPGPLVPVDTPPYFGIFYGSWLFVRVDGGAGGLAGLTSTTSGTSSSGGDYIFGDQRTGIWLQAPTVVGNHLEASWQTIPHKVDAAGGGFNATYDPQVEIDLVATFVHDTVRFQFDIVNNSAGQSHTVGLAFVQDINVQPTLNYTNEIDGPLRVPDQPYLHHEVLLSGGQVPSRWETSVQIAPASGNTTAKLHTIRGTLKPTSGSQAEPTTPSRFAYGRTTVLDAFYVLNGAKVRNFDQVWNFKPDVNIIMDKNVSAKSTDGSVVVYWDEQSVAPGQDVKRITYLGNADTENDFGAPLALSVSGPAALSYTTDRSTTPPTVGATPNPFQISAYVQNLTDLSQSGGLAIGPVNLFLDLPKGLALAPGETATKTISNVGAGGEGAVSWNVVPDPAAHVNGQLRYTVTASPNLGNGKSVQKVIEVPAPASLTLLGNATTQGLFKMASFPFLFGSASPTEILGLPASPPAIDIVRYNPVTGHYESQNTFQIGQAYWVRSLSNTTAILPIDTTKYPPLDNQVQPTATTLKLNYPKGWNQIADPYVYGFKFSELQIFDTDSLQLIDIVSASDSLHQWLLPAVYRYDTSDTSPANWHYVLEDNFGFVMEPYEGYWLYVKKANLQFIYPGTDTPGGQVTRAALVGAGIGSQTNKASIDNWKLQLAAHTNTSTDVANIGVAPKATDGEDGFKYGKPPVLNNSVQLNIVHAEWTSNTLMQDLRAPGNASKVWNLEVKSSKANEDVTLTWNNLARSVPRNYRLTLVDKDTNTRRSLQSNASYTVNTGTSGTRQIQIVADPVTRTGSVLITDFNVAQSGTRGAGGAGGAVTIRYTISQDAETQIIVRDGSGRSIRTLTPTRAAGNGTTGTGQAVWDMRDQSGAQISAGNYQLELNALGSNGQRARQIKPFIIPR